MEKNQVSSGFGGMPLLTLAREGNGTVGVFSFMCTKAQGGRQELWAGVHSAVSH